MQKDSIKYVSITALSIRDMNTRTPANKYLLKHPVIISFLCCDYIKDTSHAFPKRQLFISPQESQKCEPQRVKEVDDEESE